jgi:hypothetical protein
MINLHKLIGQVLVLILIELGKNKKNRNGFACQFGFLRNALQRRIY